MQTAANSNIKHTTRSKQSLRVTILVPQSWVRVIGDITESLPNCAVVPYEEITTNLILRIKKERIIAVIEPRFGQGEIMLRDLFNSVQELDKMQAHLLLMAGDDRGLMPASPSRKVFVLPRNTPEDLIKFTITRMIEDIKFSMRYRHMLLGEARRQMNIETLNEIGAALSKVDSIADLLDLIVKKSRDMTFADAGSLYMIETNPELAEDSENYFADKWMRFEVAQNDSRQVPFKSFQVDISKTSIYGYAAIMGETLNFEDVYKLPTDAPFQWGGRNFDKLIGYRTRSMLTVPMRIGHEETIGVIQLINKKISSNIELDSLPSFDRYVKSFNEDDIHIVESLSSQAAIAIQNRRLLSSIQALFDGFVNASVTAIEARDITTSGHSQRVASLSVGLAESLAKSESQATPLVFTPKVIQEIRYAALLHDFGKIGVREEVLLKAKKLYPEQFHSLTSRYKMIRQGIETKYLHETLDALRSRSQSGQPLDLREIESISKPLEEKMAEQINAIDDLLEQIIELNEPTVQDYDVVAKVKELSAMNFENHLGELIPFLKDHEIEALSIRRGSLTKQDRLDIESHVTHTYHFLKRIPWTDELKNVPRIAHAHHEKLDGSGYPLGISAPEISVQSRILTISDIYDALTANDRPYKKSISPELALNILNEEANSGYIDPDLLKVFIEAKVYINCHTED